MSEIFIYEGLGFPIELQDVKKVEFNNELHPIIDVKAVATAALNTLVTAAQPISGNQLIFIRTYFLLEQEKFASVINASVTDLKKWENTNNEPAMIDSKVEINIKHFVQTQLASLNVQAGLLPKKGLFSPVDKKPKNDNDETQENKNKPK